MMTVRCLKNITLHKRKAAILNALTPVTIARRESCRSRADRAVTVRRQERVTPDGHRHGHGGNIANWSGEESGEPEAEVPGAEVTSQGKAGAGC